MCAMVECCGEAMASKFNRKDAMTQSLRKGIHLRFLRALATQRLMDASSPMKWSLGRQRHVIETDGM
jgi:hypothetical protein